MEVLSIVLLIVSGVFLSVGIGFLFPTIIVGKLSTTTKGVIKDITDDAAGYNKSTIIHIGDTGLHIETGVGHKNS